MNRRGFLGMLMGAVAVPFVGLPKAKPQPVIRSGYAQVLTDLSNPASTTALQPLTISSSNAWGTMTTSSVSWVDMRGGYQQLVRDAEATYRVPFTTRTRHRLMKRDYGWSVNDAS